MPLARLKKLNTTECLWIYILKILESQETHAYTIRKEIKTRFGFQPGIMTAYKVLYLLERKGLVTKKQQGRKKIYSLTSQGTVALKEAAQFYTRLGKTLASTKSR